MMRWTSVRKVSTRHHSLLCAFSFAVLLSFATALNCDINLTVFSSSHFNPGFAQCELGCDSCSFTLDTGLFNYGTVECLADVPCFVRVTMDDRYAMIHSTVNGSQASALTVDTSLGYNHWYYAVFHAPANRGDFRFETHNSTYPVWNTIFYAENSGVVDIIIADADDGLDSASEMYSMYVWASTASTLNIVLGEGVHYARTVNSSIECPSAGKCLWQSSAQRYSYYADQMTVVKLFVFPDTDLRLLCDDNAKSCAAVFVYCKDTNDNCEMQYTSCGDWQCVGTLNSETQCYANVNPKTSTTLEPVTTTSKEANTLLVYITAGGFCVVVCFCAAAVVVYFWHREKLLRAQLSDSGTVQTNDNDSVAVDKKLIQAPLKVAPYLVHRRNSDSLITEQPGGVQLSDSNEMPSAARSEGIEREQPTDYEDEDELLYIQMGPNTVGHTQG